MYPKCRRKGFRKKDIRTLCFADDVPVTRNRHFSKMAAENSNKLKLAKVKIVYQH